VRKQRVGVHSPGQSTLTAPHRIARMVCEPSKGQARPEWSRLPVLGKETGVPVEGIGAVGQQRRLPPDSEVGSVGSRGTERKRLGTEHPKKGRDLKGSKGTKPKNRCQKDVLDSGSKGYLMSPIVTMPYGPA
jgi:hypothetical protein